MRPEIIAWLNDFTAHLAKHSSNLETISSINEHELDPKVLFSTIGHFWDLNAKQFPDIFDFIEDLFLYKSLQPDTANDSIIEFLHHLDDLLLDMMEFCETNLVKLQALADDLRLNLDLTSKQERSEFSFLLEKIYLAQNLFEKAQMLRENLKLLRFNLVTFHNNHGREIILTVTRINELNALRKNLINVFASRQIGLPVIINNLPNDIIALSQFFYDPETQLFTEDYQDFILQFMLYYAVKNNLPVFNDLRRMMGEAIVKLDDQIQMIDLAELRRDFSSEPKVVLQKLKSQHEALNKCRETFISIQASSQWITLFLKRDHLKSIPDEEKAALRKFTGLGSYLQEDVKSKIKTIDQHLTDINKLYTGLVSALERKQHSASNKENQHSNIAFFRTGQSSKEQKTFSQNPGKANQAPTALDLAMPAKLTTVPNKAISPNIR